MSLFGHFTAMTNLLEWVYMLLLCIVVEHVFYVTRRMNCVHGLHHTLRITNITLCQATWALRNSKIHIGSRCVGFFTLLFNSLENHKHRFLCKNKMLCYMLLTFGYSTVRPADWNIWGGKPMFISICPFLPLLNLHANLVISKNFLFFGNWFRLFLSKMRENDILI